MTFMKLGIFKYIGLTILYVFQESQINGDRNSKENVTTQQLSKGFSGSRNRRSQQSPPKWDVSHVGKGKWSADQDVTSTSAIKLGDRQQDLTANSQMKIKDVKKTDLKVRLSP